MSSLCQRFSSDPLHRPAAQAPPVDMYRLKAPVFSGEEDVEQFIAEFSDVAANLGMAPHVALLHK